MELDGKLALVTGAGRGIGKAIALALAEVGADVIINDISERDARETVSAVEAKGRRACTCVADVSDYATVDAAIRAAISKLGRPIDILVNNAGVGDFVSFPEITEAKWQAMLGTHLTGTFNCCKLVLPSMLERRSGKILNVSSVAGKRGDFIGNAHYTAAKAGIIGLTRSLAAYAAPHGVNVNAIAPGIVDTELTHGMGKEHKATTLSRIPIGRFAALEEIASAARFLVSNAASYVVGETLSVNGGSYMD
jgi:NAD(P)-dependent dehydrogenase (short-subunit alcohol dehydrogenase family)